MAELDQLAERSRRLRQEAAWLRRRSREVIARSQRACLRGAALIAVDEQCRAEAARRYGPDERHMPLVGPSLPRQQHAVRAWPFTCRRDIQTAQRESGVFVGIFIDRHLAEVVPEEALVRMLRETEEQLVDSRGVRIVGHWLGDRYLYCLLDAPDADAACQHHTARGLACDEPREIEGVQGTWPVSAEDDEIVRTSIARLWPAATG